MLTAKISWPANRFLGILHGGGPAPGNKLVAYAAAQRARDHKIPLLAFCNGYNHIVKTGADKQYLPLGTVEAEHTLVIGPEEIGRLYHENALLIGTGRANPGKAIERLEDLSSPAKIKGLERVLDVFEALRIGALISIGGDDTMRTANLIQMLYLMQRAEGREFEHFQGVVHVPKTIDNDYPGIENTFGYMSAAEAIGEFVAGLVADAKISGTPAKPVYFIVEAMGRDASWLAALSGFLGRASYTIVAEEYEDGKATLAGLAAKCIEVINSRRERGKDFGVIVVPEGIVKKIGVEALVRDVSRDEANHVNMDELEVGRYLTTEIARRFPSSVQNEKSPPQLKIKCRQAGYGFRQVQPNAYDTILCQRLGVSAVDAVLQGEYGNMISVDGIFNPKLVPFNRLIDPTTLKTTKKVMEVGGGLHSLLRNMEQEFNFAA
jgi:6-phosphofructokinase